eukprot:gene14719-biopygen3616
MTHPSCVTTHCRVSRQCAAVYSGARSSPPPPPLPWARTSPGPVHSLGPYAESLGPYAECTEMWGFPYFCPQWANRHSMETALPGIPGSLRGGVRRRRPGLEAPGADELCEVPRAIARRRDAAEVVRQLRRWGGRAGKGAPLGVHHAGPCSKTTAEGRPPPAHHATRAPGRNGSGRGPDADRTRGARYNSKERTRTGRGRSRFSQRSVC